MFRMKYLPASMLLAVLFLCVQAAHGSEIQVTPGMNPGALQAQTRSLPPGSTIRLMPGHYTQGLLFSELRGTPQAPIRITADGGVTLDGWVDKAAKKFNPGSGVELGKCSNVIVEGLQITGFGRGITLGSCQMVTLRANTITDVSNYGIMSYMSDGTSILENTIERSYVEHGIYISGVGKQITISKNKIRDTHINGIHINGAVVAPKISDNTLEHIGYFPTPEGGAALTLIGGVTNPVVEGNRFKDIYGQGITLDAPNAVIRDNTFDSCLWSDILGLTNAATLHLENNKFQNSKAVPLQFTKAAVASMTASGDRFTTSGPVVEETDTHKTYSFKDWQAMGKDAR
jgi:parallel beta-helix repeat protein